MSEECSQDEQNVDKGLLLTLKVIHNELAKWDQVLVYEGIYHPVVKGLINNLVLIVSVRAQYVERRAKHEEEDWEDVEER